MTRSHLILFLSLFLQNQVLSQTTLRTFELVKTQNEIIVDGVINEAEWADANILDPFLNKWPNNDGLSNTKTDVYILYDDEFLYIASKNYQKEEDLIVMSLKRDNMSNHWSSESFTMILDPFNNQSSGYLFGVNAGGTEVESQLGINSFGTSMDVNWNTTWKSKVQVSSNYWTVEIAIPLKSLNYSAITDHWGINFVRKDMKTNEFSTWSHVPNGFSSYDITNLGNLTIKDIPQKKRPRPVIIPSLLSSRYSDFQANSNTDLNVDLGLDVKVPINNNFKVDITVNPDFSTIDVDQQVTNLSRFSIFFPEKREFFMESSDLFTNYGSPYMRPFFSRNIGISNGQFIPILYGARATGNISPETRIGLLNIQTRSTQSNTADNFTVLSLQHQLSSTLNFKTLFTNRSGYGFKDGYAGNFNTTYGGEIIYRSLDNKWSSNIRLHDSKTEDDLSDTFFMGITTIYKSGNFTLILLGEQVSDNYINDLSFSSRQLQYNSLTNEFKRIGFRVFDIMSSYSIFPDNPKINNHNFHYFNSNTYTIDGNLTDRAFQFTYSLLSTNNNRFVLRYVNRAVGLLFPTNLINGPEDLPIGDYIFNRYSIMYMTDSRRPLSLELSSGLGGFYNGNRYEYGGSINFRAQPWGVFKLKYIGNHINLPENYGNTTLHLIGPQSEISFSSTLNWTTFIQYNTQASNLNINSRFQWRFAPMSDLFLTYSDNYQTDSFIASNRGIYLKLKYWID